MVLLELWLLLNGKLLLGNVNFYGFIKDMMDKMLENGLMVVVMSGMVVEVNYYFLLLKG